MSKEHTQLQRVSLDIWVMSETKMKVPKVGHEQQFSRF